MINVRYPLKTSFFWEIQIIPSLSLPNFPDIFDSTSLLSPKTTDRYFSINLHNSAKHSALGLRPILNKDDSLGGKRKDGIDPERKEIQIILIR